MALEEKRHAMFDFSGGMVPDKPIRVKGNELLQAKNVILNPGGDFEKRKGTELLTSSGISVRPKDDVWGYILRVQGQLDNECGEGADPDNYKIWWIFETAEGTLDKIVIVDFDTTANAQTYYDAWVSAAISRSYNSPYTYSDANYVCEWGASGIAGAISVITNAAHYNEKTIKTLTQAQLGTINYCIFGMWKNVAEDAGKTGEGSYDVEEDIMNSGIELSRRNTSTNARERIRIATYYNSTTAYMITCDHASDNSLAITALTAIKSDLWVDGKPDWDIYQNRAFMVNGVGDGVGTPDRLWTDGTNVHNIGITAPATTPVYVSTATTGGYLEDGTYRFKYSFYRSDEYTSNSNTTTGYVEKAITGGTATQTITLTFTYSAEDQVDKLRVYRTKKGATSTYYYEQQFANVDGTGTVNKACGTVADGSLKTQASDSGLGTGNERPPASNYICMAGNRGWYATETYVYYSQLGYPEQVPSVNLIPITPDDGESIVNLQTFSNYVLVQKNTKTFLIDANNPDYIKPQQISNNIGTIAKRSGAVCINGQLFAFLSQEGFYICDGVKTQSICDGRIYRNLMQNVDKARISYSEAIYYPNDMQYMCYVPYLNDQYRFWVYSFQVDCWQQFTWDFRPHSITLWTDENDIKRLVIGTFLKGVESGRRSYFGHFIQADYEWYKDVDMSATCGASATTYQAITSTVVTSPDFIGSPDKEKTFTKMHLYLQNTAESTTINPVVTWASKFGRGSANRIDSGDGTANNPYRISHTGIANVPSESDWQHGYDYIDVFDYQSLKAIDCRLGELKGNELSIKFYESSQNFWRTLGYMIDYREKLVGRGE